VQHIRGERNAAWNTLAAARQLAQQAATPRRQRLVDAVTAELQLREGNVAAAARTLGETRGAADSASEFERLTYVRLFLAQGQPRMAESALNPLEETARTEKQAGRLITIQVLQALCKRAQGNRAAALESLEDALSLAATPGYQRVFLDEGAPVSALLGQLRHVAPGFVNSLIEAFRHHEEAMPAAAALPMPLSRTQLEILHLLDFGLSNQEIASKLRITVGTTKWHLNQMFAKLEAHSRTDVLAKARQLGLL
jgi:LuxR family maltose regulon positive regulatory protein